MLKKRKGKEMNKILEAIMTILFLGVLPMAMFLYVIFFGYPI